MAASVGHAADSGSLPASRGSELSARFVNDVLPKRHWRYAENPGPHWSTNQIALLQRSLDKGSPLSPRARQAVQKSRPSIQPPPGGVNHNQIGENRWASTLFVRL